MTLPAPVVAGASRPTVCTRARHNESDRVTGIYRAIQHVRHPIPCSFIPLASRPFRCAVPVSVKSRLVDESFRDAGSRGRRKKKFLFGPAYGALSPPTLPVFSAERFGRPLRHMHASFLRESGSRKILAVFNIFQGQNASALCVLQLVPCDLMRGRKRFSKVH